MAVSGGEVSARARIKSIAGDAAKWGGAAFLISGIGLLFWIGFSWWTLILAVLIGGSVTPARRKHLMDRERELATARLAHEGGGFK